MHFRAHEGLLYLPVVVDLYSRRIVGWSRQSGINKEPVRDANLMAVWRRKPEDRVIVHSDQGSQYTSQDSYAFLKAHNLHASVSQRGNCHDNAVTLSFSKLLKRRQIKRHIYTTRIDARTDITQTYPAFHLQQGQMRRPTCTFCGFRAGCRGSMTCLSRNQSRLTPCQSEHLTRCQRSSAWST